MALSEDNGIWPYTGYNFDVAIGGKYYSFKEVSGLELVVETEDKEEDNLTIKIPSGKRKFGTLSLKRGMVPSSSDLAKWVKEIEKDPLAGKLDIRPIDIYLMDDTGTDLMYWQVKDAYPIKYTVGPLNSMENTLAIESIEFAYREFVLNSYT